MDLLKFSQFLEKACSDIEITLSDQQIKSFYQLLTLYKKWSQRISLSSIHDEVEVIEKHFVDSLFGVSLLKQSDRLADIGSGAGFPGIPLKIVKNGIKLGLFERRAKKTTYLKHVVRTLNFTRTNVYEIDTNDSNFQEKTKALDYNIIVIRGVHLTADLIKQLKGIFSQAVLYVYAGLQHPFQDKTLSHLPYKVAKEGFVNNMSRTIFSLDFSALALESL
ncbi:MAG: 16S rRNA (guanine(527)-N(7))-methyltransferase RsmG [Deltaproteobacteria bacterium]|nr:16S rRNA (guanine(527)-N(7))-methyltransferase RsmG [Deltaproteobacteria bacterium]